MIDKRYKKIKKTIEPCYTAPLLLQHVTGASVISSNGVFMNNVDMYSRIYRTSGDLEEVKVKEVFNTLRSTNMYFEFYRDLRKETDIYITSYTYAGSINEAIKNFNDIEKILNPLFSEFNIFIKPLDFNERMKLIHKILSFSFIEDKSKVSDYMSDLNEWMDDFTIEVQYDFTINPTLFYASKKYYKFCFVRSFSDTSTDHIMNILLENKNINFIKTSLQSVTDYAAALKFKNTFLDYEIGLNKLKRKDMDLYQVLTGKTKTYDTKTYTLISISFMIESNSEKELENVFKGLQNQLLTMGCYLDFNYGAMFDAFGGILPGCRPEMNQQRIFKSKHSYMVLPFLSEKKLTIENEENKDDGYDNLSNLKITTQDVNNEDKSNNDLSSNFDNLII